MEKPYWLRRGGLAGALWLAVASAALGQKWASDMFDHTSHDFGAVAARQGRTSLLASRISTLRTPTSQSVRSSCGCTATRITKSFLKTWDTADVGGNHRHAGDSWVTRTPLSLVVFDQPFSAEVQLQVHCNIRGDVVVQPGEVAVWSGHSGDARSSSTWRSATPAAVIGTSSAWRARDASLAAATTETSRVGGRVDYDLAVTLQASAPLGYLRNDLILVTDDANPAAARVPVPVEATIRPSIAIDPSPLLMGSVSPGEAVTRQLIVHARLAVSCGPRRVERQAISVWPAARVGQPRSCCR